MRVFITGVAGFLGSHLADNFTKEGHHVMGADSLIGGDMNNVSRGSVLLTFDCRNLETLTRVMQEFKPDVVYHTACYPHEGLSVFSPTEISDSVFRTSVAVMTASINSGVKRVVNMSSMARYGDRFTPPFHEWHVTGPVDPYGMAKVAAENVMRLLAKVHNIEFINTIPHNLVGKNQKYDDPYRNVVSIMCNRMLQGKPPIIYGDGKQTRCFSHIDDVIPTLFAMSNLSNKVIVGEDFNIGPDENPISIYELFKVISKQLGFKKDPIFYPDRPQEVKHAACSSDKIRKFFGYSTRRTIDDMVADVIAHIRERGTRPFKYHLDLEIVNEKTPRTWSKKEMSQ